MPGRTLRRPSDSRPSRTRDEERDERDNDPENEPEEPRSRRGSSRPQRRSAPAPRRDEDDERPRRGSSRSRDDDDEDTGSSTAGGWGSWREKKAAMSNFGEEFKVDYKRKYIIRMLDDAPYATFGQHWLEDMPKGERKSYVCLGEDCPLCEMLGSGDDARPRPLARFNVVEFVEEKRDGETVMTPKHKFWEMGSGVAQILEDYADDAKTSPLSDFYWQVSKSKSSKKGPTTYTIVPVKERDLWDDHGVEALTDEEFNDFLDKRFDDKHVRRDSREDLEEIAEDYVNG